jgi:uncharacterized protein (PEP-CTERM system associated)
MQLLGVRRAGRGGKFAWGSICALLFVVGVSSGAQAQAVSSSVFFAFSPPTEKDDTREFSVTPTVGVLESFTDNVLVSSTNQKADLITRPIVGADMNVRTGVVTATVSGHVFYDAYASQSNLSSFAADASGTGTYVLVPDFLSIDAQGVLANTNGSTFGTPAIERAGSGSRVQLSTYNIGPRLTTTVDDFADLTVIGRFAQAFYNRPSGSTFNVPPGSTFFQGSATLDTDERYAGYQSVTNGLYERDDHGFESYSGLQSFFVSVAPQIRIIGRGGYDSVVQPGIVNIKAPIWSGGAELSINEQSRITVETGERFNHSAWAADVHLQLSDQLYVLGRYYETLEPPQIQFSSSFVNFVATADQIPVGVAPATFTFNGNLDNQTSLNKAAEFHLVFNWEEQTLEYQTSWDDRFLIAANAHDRTWLNVVSYGRNIAADLDLNAGITYWRTFSNPFFGASELYGGTVGLRYQINPTMRLAGGYVFQHQAQLVANGQSIDENVVFAAIAKSF